MGMQRVLVVDDSQNIQRLIKAVLVGHQLDVMVKESAHDLVNWVRTHEIDLVLLDFSIDESTDCYHLVSKVKSAAPHCKVVFLYGTFDEPDREKIGQYGVDDYIFKPFDGEKLVKTCLQLLGRDLRQQRPVRTDAFEKQELLQRLEEEVSHWNFPVPEVIEEVAENEALHENLDQEEFGISLPGILTSSRIEVREKIIPSSSAPKLQSEQLSSEKLERSERSEKLENDQAVKPGLDVSKEVLQEHHHLSHANVNKSLDLPASKSALKAKNQLKFPIDSELEFPQTAQQKSQAIVPQHQDRAEFLEEHAADSTAIVNVQKLEQLQEDKIGRLKAQIKEELEGKVWDSPEENHKSRASAHKNRLNLDSHQHQSQKTLPAAEELFSQVEREAMKKEILAEIREKMIFDLKKEFRDQLRQELTQEWSNALLLSIKDQVQQELLELSTQFLSEQLVNSVKQHHLQQLLLDLRKRLDLLVESSWNDEWHETVKKDLVIKMLPKAEELVKQELSAIRSKIDHPDMN